MEPQTIPENGRVLPDVVAESVTMETSPGYGRPDPDVVNKLSDGVLDHMLPELQKAKSVLADLTMNQHVLIETVVQENNKFQNCAEATLLAERMAKAKLYHSKLLNIKKDMAAMHEKATRLKRHALKLQQQKQKEALQLEQQRERELEKERSLVAKMAKKPMKSSQPASKDGHSEAARLSPAPPHQGAAHTPIAGETMDSTQDENEVKS